MFLTGIFLVRCNFFPQCELDHFCRSAARINYLRDSASLQLHAAIHGRMPKAFGKHASRCGSGVPAKGSRISKTVTVASMNTLNTDNNRQVFYWGAGKLSCKSIFLRVPSPV